MLNKIFSITVIVLLLSGLVQAKEYRVALPKFSQADNSQYFIFVYPLIFSKIEEMTGDTFVYDYYSPAMLKTQFDKGTIDIQPGINPVWVSDSNVESLFSVPFTQATTLFLHQRGKAFDTHQLSNFKGKIIGIVDGYIYKKLDDAINSGKIAVSRSPDQESLLRELLVGKHEHIIVSKQLAGYWLDQRNKKSAVEYGNVLSETNLMMRIHPRNKELLPRFNRALQTLVDEGTIDRIYDPLFSKM